VGPLIANVPTPRFVAVLPQLGMMLWRGDAGTPPRGRAGVDPVDVEAKHFIHAPAAPHARDGKAPG
jgi:hypothetical protein